MDRKLIYMVCCGDPVFAQMTDLCIDSLRRWGRYEGDVVVVSDGCYARAAPGVRVVEIERPPTPAHMKLVKSFAARSVDADAYDQVVVMDIDMVAVADVNPFFRARGKTVYGMREYGFNTMLADSCGGRLLRLEERPAAARRWGINAGFLCMPSRYFQHYMALWRIRLAQDARHLNFWADQPYFNCMVLRGDVPFRAYPPHWIDMPPMYPWFNGQFEFRPDVRLLHLCGEEKEQCLARMAAVAEGLERGWTHRQLRLLFAPHG